MVDLRYFTEDELKCPDTGIVGLAKGFGGALDALRESYGKPMVINSGCRSSKYNDSIGGHSRSLHVYDEPYHPTGGCCAVDVRMHDSGDRAKFVEKALVHGWSVGVAKNFIHVDRRSDYINYPQVLYVY